jgi:hypothetical protein
MSIFHVPSKALCAAARIGINRAAAATKKNSFLKNSFFITNPHQFELRAGIVSESTLTIGKLCGALGVWEE